MDIIAFTPQPPPKFLVGQRVRIFSERGDHFARITAGPSHRPSDFGTHNPPSGYFAAREDNGRISAVMTPNIGPLLADPADLVPRELVAIVPMGWLQQAKAWIAKPETIRMLLKKAGYALAMAALKRLYSFFMHHH